VQDSEDYDIKRHFPDAIAFLDDVKRARGRSLVHCNLGVNRSGAVCAAYLMVSERRTLLDVVAYLRARRSLVLANKGFRRQLVAFARERRLLDPVIINDGIRGTKPVAARWRRCVVVSGIDVKKRSNKKFKNVKKRDKNKKKRL